MIAFSYLFLIFLRSPINGIIVDINFGRSKYISNKSIEEFLLPYIIYYDTCGNPCDRYFDTFVIIDYVFYNNEYMATKYWWNDFINHLFEPQYKKSLPLIDEGYKGKKGILLSPALSYIWTSLSNIEALSISFYAKTIGKVSKAGYFGFKAFPTDIEFLLPNNNFVQSDYLGIFYKYFEADKIWQHHNYKISLNSTVDSIQLFIGKWQSTFLFLDEVKITASNRVFYSNFEKKDRIWNFSCSQRDYPAKEVNFISYLDSLVRKCSFLIGEKNLKLDVIIMIPWSYLSAKGCSLRFLNSKDFDLTTRSGANMAVKWFIDEVIKRWTKTKPHYLKLLGFYWLNEEGGDITKVNIKEIYKYINAKGYILVGSCYNKYWRFPSLDTSYFNTFNIIFMQPNVWPVNYKKESNFYNYVQKSHEMGGLSKDTIYIKRWGIPIEELVEIQKRADSLDAGIVIEWVAGQEQLLNRGRVLDYCNNKGKLEHSFMGRDILVFDNSGFGQFCSRSEEKIFRNQYDEVYNFVKLNRQTESRSQK